MPSFVPIISFVIIAALWLPIPLRRGPLLKIAFAICLLAGLSLILLGMTCMYAINAGIVFMAATYFAALLMGFVTDKCILRSMFHRNLERISHENLSGKLIPIFDLPNRLFVAVIFLFTLLSEAFGAPIFWRGILELAIGFSWMFSSTVYLNKLALPFHE